MIELEEDIVIRMLPKKSYKVKVIIKSVKKGELNIVEPLEIKKEN